MPYASATPARLPITTCMTTSEENNDVADLGTRLELTWPNKDKFLLASESVIASASGWTGLKNGGQAYQ